MSTRCLSLIALILLVLAGRADATDYFFAAAGNDGNACTSSGAPCKTVAKAQTFLSSLSPGDEILFNRGDTFTAGLTLPSHLNGTSANRITIGNYGNGALPIFDGLNSIAACVNARQTGGGATPIFSYITIDGIECKNTTQYGVLFYQNAGGSFGMPGIIVQNMNIHNTGPATDDGNYRNQLMFLDENKKADGVQFLNNTVGACGGHNCIQIQKDIGSPVISGNYCYAPWNHNCVDLKSVVGATVTSNIVNGTGSTNGSAYYHENVEIPASDVTFTFNQAYNAPNGIECEWGGTGNPALLSTTCNIYNNTLSLGTESAIVTGGDPSCGTVVLNVRNNILDTTSIFFNGHSCVTPTWDYNDDGATHTPPATPRGAHDLVGVNPLWVNAAARNYRLAAGSLCINAGLFGLTSNPNMGSELAASAPTPTPTTTATRTATPTATSTATPTSTPTPTTADAVLMKQGPTTISRYVNVPICTFGDTYLGVNTWSCVTASAPISIAIKTVADSPYAVPTASVFLFASASAGADFTANLPAATGSARVVEVKRLDNNTAHAVLVAPNGTDTIDGVNASDDVTRQNVVIDYIDYTAGAWARW